tara:strand:- start:271 stop:798 length:528 start_codon:yes stop_codon:yes gene_type:complete
MANQIVGQLGPDGKPITLFDAMMGVRPGPNQPLGIDYNAMRQNLTGGPAMQPPPLPGFMDNVSNMGIMDTLKGYFGVPMTSTEMVDGNMVTNVDRSNILNTGNIPGKLNEMATGVDDYIAGLSGDEAMSLVSGLQGLLGSGEQQPLKAAPIASASPGLRLDINPFEDLYKRGLLR